MNDDEFPSAKQVASGGMKYGLAVIVVIMVLSAVIGLWSVFTASARMAGNVVTKVFDADHALQTYRWFHEAYQQVEAKKAQIRLAKSALESAATDRKEARRVELLGTQQVCQSLVAEYNAKATRADTVIFQHPESFLPGNWPGEKTPLPMSINLASCD